MAAVHPKSLADDRLNHNKPASKAPNDNLPRPIAGKQSIRTSSDRRQPGLY